LPSDLGLKVSRAVSTVVTSAGAALIRLWTVAPQDAEQAADIDRGLVGRSGERVDGPVGSRVPGEQVSGLVVDRREAVARHLVGPGRGSGRSHRGERPPRCVIDPIVTTAYTEPLVW
jgi:hypothetical protein